MSESLSSPVAGRVAEHAAGPLTAERIEAVLADFRAWLEQLAADRPNTGAPADDGLPAVDLYSLVSQFVALRHEVNLQTKASRAQQQQNADSLRQLSDAVELLKDVRLTAVEPEAEPEAERPLLKSLIEMHDALSIAARELERVSVAGVAPLGRLATPTPLESSTSRPDPFLQPLKPMRPAFWERWLAPGHSAVLARLIQQLQQHFAQERARFEAALHSRDQRVAEAVTELRRSLDSLRIGFAMSLERVQRGLERHGLEPIMSAGQPFDPETMEVVEATLDPSRPSGAVIEEVRRGYRWNGRVFRCAQVRVAKH